MTPVIILDTDMDTDCDDAGALALAAGQPGVTLAKKGKDYVVTIPAGVTTARLTRK